MESKELRLGISVLFNETVSIVTNINHSTVRLYVNNDLEDLLVNKENIRPIVLTEECIQKLGFFCFGKKRNWFDIQVSKGYEISINTEGKISIGQTGNWTTLNFIKKIEYVHQLQNLYFALTGKELEYVS